jgi:hypothetical protein
MWCCVYDEVGVRKKKIERKGNEADILPCNPT